MKEPNIELAKKRIWKRLATKLPDRGLSTHVFAVSQLRQSREAFKSSPLTRVQFKERLLDILPDPTPAFSFPRRVWAFGTLSLFLGALFVPVMGVVPVVSASSENLLEPVSGEVFVNGVLVHGLTSLQEGDLVETGEGALAHVYLVDDSRITLGPSTSVDLVSSFVDPENRAKTFVHIQENSGRVWSQVVNLVSNDSSFQLSFPSGQIFATQKASFDVQVNSDLTTAQVARNLVSFSLLSDGELYEGVLGQGGRLVASDGVESGLLSEDEQKDVWWTFNLAFGKSYTRTLDANYKKENVDRAVILPGNPLYVLKTFRENLQVSFAFTEDARQQLLVQQAQNRLDEAQTLLARGQTAEATQVLDVYQKTVEQVSNTDNTALLAQVDETQKQILVAEDAQDVQLLQGHLSDASAMVSSDLAQKSEVKMQSVSQTLQQVPDLIDAGDYDVALQVLSVYQSKSLSVLSELDDVPMDLREAVVSGLLEQKLSDIQQMRVIASMPQLQGLVDTNTILEQMSVMLLSLREKELGDLSAFFSAHDYDTAVQQQMYDRLKEGAELTPQISEQLDTMESQISAVDPMEVLIEVQSTEETASTEEDPRFSVSHSDETQNQSDARE